IFLSPFSNYLLFDTVVWRGARGDAAARDAGGDGNAFDSVDPAYSGDWRCFEQGWGGIDAGAGGEDWKVFRRVRVVYAGDEGGAGEGRALLELGGSDNGQER